MLKRVRKIKLKTRYRKFNQRLEKLNKKPRSGNMNKCSILKFLDPKNDLLRYLNTREKCYNTIGCI